MKEIKNFYVYWDKGYSHHECGTWDSLWSIEQCKAGGDNWKRDIMTRYIETFSTTLDVPSHLLNKIKESYLKLYEL